MTPNRRTISGLLLVGLGISLLLAPMVGMEFLSFGDSWFSQQGSPTANIFWAIRVPRVLTAFLAGAALSVSGMTFQGLFRNALATPFTLGVASGAALGASLGIWLGLGHVPLGLPLASFFGALFSISVVYGLTRLKGGFTTSALLLAGVAMSFFFSSLILTIQYLSNFTESFRIVRWLMGGLDILGFKPLLTMLPFVLVGLALVFFLSQELNLLSTGEELAHSRGVEVDRTKKWLFLATSLMVGAVVAICGPIGFVGMMIPHMCRLLFGPEHRRLTLVSLVFGGAFLVWCDTLARTLIAPAEIPVGILTSLLGGPFFLWILLSRSNRFF